LAELVDLGHLVIAHGRRPKGSAKTRPNFYRITFLPDHKGVWPSEEWRRFEPSEGADYKAWAAALVRAKVVARAARKRRVCGKPPFRSEEEADAAVAPAELVLKRVGKDKRIGRPGNKQTRAALNEVSSRGIHFPGRDGSSRDHGTDHPVENAKYRTDRPVDAYGTDRHVPSTTLVHLAAEARASSERAEDAARAGSGGAEASSPRSDARPRNGSPRPAARIATPIVIEEAADHPHDAPGPTRHDKPQAAPPGAKEKGEAQHD